MIGSFVRDASIKQWLLLTVIGCVAGGCSNSNQPASNQALLVGRWKVKEGIDPKGAVYEFTRDGKMTYTHPDNWGWTKTYQVEGDQINYKGKENGVLEKSHVTILTLTNDTLVLSLGTNVDIHGKESKMSSTLFRIGK